MKYKWTRITESVYEHLVERCNFTPVELRILESRRKGKSLSCVADELGYSERHLRRISNDVLAKIEKENQKHTS